MLRCSKFLTLLLLLSPAIGFARGVPTGESPAFTPVPELSAGFDLLYEQKFSEARQIFANWESRNREDPFGGVAVAASYLFEELYLQGVLTSEFFLNEKKFLHGIDGRPNPERMSHFGEALTRARELAKMRQKANPNDGEALFALTLAAGMDATDAYIALGIANYIIGSQGAGARFALWFDGIHGDKKLGMEQVARAAANGRYLRPFAKIILALAACRENQAALARELLRELIEQYPDSELYASEYAKVSSLPVPAALAH
jgi:hypothetical protein